MTFDEHMQVLGVLGSWLAGLGSLAAVIVALWLARRGTRVRLHSTVGLRVMVGGEIVRQECLQISTTNLGERPVVIDTIVWRVGKRKNTRHAIPFFSDGLSDRLPKRLEHGETATFRIFFPEPSIWVRDHFAGLVDRQAGRPGKSLRFEIHTSTGHRETVVPEQPVLDLLESMTS